jgi:hypothetical protein
MKRALLIVAIAALAFFATAGGLSWRDARRLADRERQARGALTAAEASWQAADLARGRAESSLVDAKTAAEKYRLAFGRESADAKRLRAEVSRLSMALFSVRAELDGLKASVTPSTDADPSYLYRLPWFSFHTPDVRRAGGERLTFDLRAKLTVGGLRQSSRKGILESESVDLRFLAPDGSEVPLGVKLDDYRFEYVAPELARDRWYQRVHLDVWAGVATPPYEVASSDRLRWTRAAVGIEARLWGAAVGLTGEAGLDGDLRGLLTVGYRRDVLGGK